jgi:hypothetical protein
VIRKAMIVSDAHAFEKAFVDTGPVGGASPASLNERTIGKNEQAAAYTSSPQMTDADEKAPSAIAVRQTLTIAFNVILIAAAVSLIMGTISCICRPAEGIDAARSARLAELQRSRMDGYLYAAAMLLVTGLFFIAAGLRWSAGEGNSHFLRHVNVLILYFGIFFSTLLASYYVPAALWLRRSLELVSQAAPATAIAKTPDGTVADDGSFLDLLSPSRLLKAIVAILAPLIVGLLPQLIHL